MKTLIWQAKSTTKSKKEYTYNMGAIQNSITGALGAVAGAAVAGKHMKDVKEAKLEAKEAKLEGAKEDLSFSEAELKQAQAVQAEIGNQLGDAKNALAEAEGNFTT